MLIDVKRISSKKPDFSKWDGAKTVFEIETDGIAGKDTTMFEAFALRDLTKPACIDWGDGTKSTITFSADAYNSSKNRFYTSMIGRYNINLDGKWYIDGVEQESNFVEINHTYKADGKYTISISDNVANLAWLADYPYMQDYDYHYAITQVKSFGPSLLRIGSVLGMESYSSDDVATLQGKLD